MSDKPEQKNSPKESSKAESKPKPKCGIIMPIAGFGTYTESHWNEVFRIIKRAAEKAGFEAAMVSTGTDVGVIHANIINNIYSNEMVVCDVSGKNANVMFELGLRLASKLPVIIIKDELTGYSFDTSPIQHLSYRSDLRLFATLEFEDDLAQQIRGTYERSLQPNYKTFLDHFGSYSLAKVEDKAIDLSDFMGQIFSRLDSIEQNQSSTNRRDFLSPKITAPTSTKGNIDQAKALLQPYVNGYLTGRVISNVEQFENAYREVDREVKTVFANEIGNLPLYAVNQAIRSAVESFVIHNDNPRASQPFDN